MAFLVALLVMIVVSELLLSKFRVFEPHPRYPPGVRPNEANLHAFLQPDEATGWLMKPHEEYTHTSDEFEVVYRSNGQGYRSEREFDDGLSPRRVVVVGDSFTFGIAVNYEETYGRLIEDSLGDFVVCNLAMPGYGVDQMWFQIREKALEMQPALIVVGVCDADLARSQSGFSLPNGMNKPALMLEDGKLRERTPADGMNPVSQFLEERSHIRMACRQVLRGLNYRKPLSEWWYLNEAILDLIQRECDAAGIPVLFVYLPTPEWRDFPTMANYMSDRGANYIDLTTREGAHQELLHYPKDRHFTPAGHAWVAEQIVSWIHSTLTELGQGGGSTADSAPADDLPDAPSDSTNRCS